MNWKSKFEGEYTQEELQLMVKPLINKLNDLFKEVDTDPLIYNPEEMRTLFMDIASHHGELVLSQLSNRDLVQFYRHFDTDIRELNYPFYLVGIVFDRLNNEIDRRQSDIEPIDNNEDIQDKTKIGILIKLGIVEQVSSQLIEPKNSVHISKALLAIGVKLEKDDTLERYIRKYIDHTFWNDKLETKVKNELAQLNLK